MIDMGFYKNKKVLITGHTGFKGSWLCEMLLMAEAEVTGYALEPNTTPALFDVISLKNRMNSVIGDVRDLNHLKRVFAETQPEIVFHLAAQPIVRESYKNPVDTYEINVMGTVNVLECVRCTPSVKSFLNVTTDKVYLNREWEWGYRETDELNGFDPYSNSKSCSELVTASYKNSFFADGSVAISTARAGNVIGGGDFAPDRIIPDCIRASVSGEEIGVRNPYSIRPYQHVLEPLSAYLLIAKEQYEHPEKASNYNVGPRDVDCITTGELVSIFCETWNRKMKQQTSWSNKSDHGPHEANFLKLDCSKIKTKLSWCPHWDIAKAIEKTIEWEKAYLEKEDIVLCMQKQIREYAEGGI